MTTAANQFHRFDRFHFVWLISNILLYAGDRRPCNERFFFTCFIFDSNSSHVPVTNVSNRTNWNFSNKLFWQICSIYKAIKESINILLFGLDSATNLNISIIFCIDVISIKLVVGYRSSVQCFIMPSDMLSALVVFAFKRTSSRQSRILLKILKTNKFLTFTLRLYLQLREN